MKLMQFYPDIDGNILRVSNNNPFIGTIVLKREYDPVYTKNGEIDYYEADSYYALIGEIQYLNQFIDNYVNQKGIPGKTVQYDFLESAIPEKFKKLIREELDYENAIDPFLKKQGPRQNTWMSKGERILSFFEYDPTGLAEGVWISYENDEDIKLESMLRKESLLRDFHKQREEAQSLGSITQEDVDPSNEFTASTQIIQDKSSYSNSKKTNQSVEDKNTPKEHSPLEKSFGTILISVIVIAYIGYIIIENDRIARMEGSSLWEQLMLLFAAIGVYAIYKALKNK